MILAKINDTLYKAQVEQAKATLDRSVADLGQMNAKEYEAKRDLARAEELRKKGAIADSDYDLYVANEKTAAANVKDAEATIEQNKAALQIAQANLDYCTISSTVEGTVIDRRVAVGQTVVSSLNTPSLFLIAKDLHRVQVWASVNEADIGRIQPGIQVNFTVDAYPKEVFHGKVIQVRLNAQMTQTVVTYPVVVETENANLKLMPYMTANLNFEIEKFHDVLLVPNGALRWKPRPALIVPELRNASRTASSGKSGGKKAAGDGGHAQPAGTPAGAAGGTAAGDKSGSAAKSAAPAKDAQPKERGQLWVQEGNYVRPINVTLGATDGIKTIVSGKNLQDVKEVVIGEAVAAADDDTNPFAPKLPFKGKAPPKKD
jgi:HlyD family secretion protein